MKKCTKCLILRDKSEFSIQLKYPDGLSYWCSKCWKIYRKNRYNSDLERSRQNTNDKRAARIRWFQELKTNIPCVDCNQIYEPYCMDYDHIIERGIKINEVSRMVLDNTPKDVILAEIAKCDLVCLLCHNRRTKKRFDDNLGGNRKYRPPVKRNIAIINTFKTQSCVICNQQYEHFNMQIDHLDPITKLYDVCQLKSRKVEILNAELAKCQVLCALCHRRKSIIEQKNGQYYINRPKPLSRKKMFFDLDNKRKECSICNEIKDFSNFFKQVKNKDGLTSACKNCLSISKKKNRGTFKDNPLPNDQKQCSKCNIIKSIYNFSKRTDGGLFSWCKGCFNEYRRKRRKANV